MNTYYVNEISTQSNSDKTQQLVEFIEKTYYENGIFILTPTNINILIASAKITASVIWKKFSTTLQPLPNENITLNIPNGYDLIDEITITPKYPPFEQRSVNITSNTTTYVTKSQDSYGINKINVDFKLATVIINKLILEQGTYTFNDQEYINLAIIDIPFIYEPQYPTINKMRYTIGSFTETINLNEFVTKGPGTYEYKAYKNSILILIQAERSTNYTHFFMTTYEPYYHNEWLVSFTLYFTRKTYYTIVDKTTTKTMLTITFISNNSDIQNIYYDYYDLSLLPPHSREKETIGAYCYLPLTFN